MSENPHAWFRLYASIVDDDKVRLLAFEDRWHFVALCALMCDGLLVRQDDPLLERKIAIKLGIQQRELDEIKRRLMEVGLIDDGFRPLKWDKRQYKKPNLPDGESLDGYNGYVYFIGDETMELVKIGFSKNPWARVKDFQTSHTARLSVVATVRTTEVSEATIHGLFQDERRGGEWFEVSERIQAVITEAKAKRLADADAVVAYVGSYVAATNTETETETEKEEAIASSASDDAPALKPVHVFEHWNTVAARLGKRQVRDHTPARVQLVRCRIGQYSLDDFAAVFAAVGRSAFLREGRFCTFDWLMKRANFQKVLEGNYDD